MNTKTLDQMSATVGEPGAFKFGVMPLALPEPVESQLRRHGIEPWMFNDPASEDNFGRACERLGDVEVYARISAVRLVGRKFSSGDAFDLLYTLPGDGIRETALDVFKERRASVARWVADAVVRERARKAAKRKSRQASNAQKTAVAA